MLYKMVNGERIELKSQEEIEIKAEWDNNEEEARKNKYKTDRIRNYPAIEDQLDSIFKTFKYLDSKGIDLGVDGKAWIEQIQSIKNKFDKNLKLQ